MAHVMKVPKSGIGAMIKHNKRLNKEYSNKNIDRERTHLNYSLCSNDMNEKQVIEYAESFMKRKRKDANYICNWVVSKPGNLKEEDEKRFFESVNSFLTERYGRDSNQNIVYSEVHLDESNPHIHFGFVPLAKNKDGTLSCSAKRVICRADLRTFHTDLSNYVEKELGYHVDIENGKTLGKSMGELKAETEYYNLHKQKLAETEKQLELTDPGLFNIKKQNQLLQTKNYEQSVMIKSLENQVKLSNNIQSAEKSLLKRSKRRLAIQEENYNQKQLELNDIQRTINVLNTVKNASELSSTEAFEKYETLANCKDTNALQAFIQSLLKLVDKLRSKIKELNRSISALKRSETEHTRHISFLEEKVSQLVDEKSSLVSKNNKLQKQSDNMKHTLTSVLRNRLCFSESLTRKYVERAELNGVDFNECCVLKAKIQGKEFDLSFTDETTAMCYINEVEAEGLNIGFIETETFKRLDIEREALKSDDSPTLQLKSSLQSELNNNKSTHDDIDFDL